MDKNREAFEAWCMNQCNYDTSKKDRTGSYRSIRTTLAFKVWQASRQAIEVELPTKLPEEELTNLSYNLGLEHASVAIKYVGIRVREE
ncbi:hypothetical protein ACT3RT_14075 [Ewingella sp. AOP9-I1-14]